MEQPAFETDNFSISYLSTSPDGFDLKSEGVLGKTEGELEPVRLTDEERDQLKAAMQGEMHFQGANKIREARSQWREAVRNDASNEEISRLGAEFRQARQDYHERGKKIGLRALHLTDENTLSAHAKVVHFPVYDHLAKASARPEMHEFADVSTVSMAVITTDNRLLIQHRAITKARITEPGFRQGNGMYADIPGASAAGHLDASMRSKSRKPGMPDPVNKEYILEAITKEVEEELGLDASDLHNMRIAGLAVNNVKPHDEFLLLADTNLTSRQVKETSHDSTLNKNLGDADFEEKFIDIEASPEAIATLLGEVKCPIAPTHVAVMVAAGYNQALKRDGQEAADQWKDRLQQSITENYRDIDARVNQYYQQHPEALHQIPERYWGRKYVPKRNPNAYDPAYGPEEQGLPSFHDEMIRTGLMSETRRHVEKGYLLDVDGVITDPIEKRVIHESIIDDLADKLNNGNPVGLNSGRSTAWVEANVLPHLTGRIIRPDALQNLIIIGEKGGTWTTFSEDGVRMHDASPKLKLPTGVREKVDELLNKKYSESMFISEEKESMLSVEMRDGYDLSDFKQQQQDFLQEAANIVADRDDWHIDPTTIATDFENIHAGKALGADRFLDFLKARNIVVANIEAYGDSASDLAMADELERRGQAVEFSYVGTDAQLSGNKSYIVNNVGGYTSGTAAILKSRR